MKNQNTKNKSKNTKHHTGRISLSRKGVGYVDIGWEDDIEIPRESLNCSLDGDTVEIVLFPKQKGERQRGEVTKILQAKKRKFAGKIVRADSITYVDTDSKKMYVDITIPEKEASQYEVDDKVLVEIISWENPLQNPQGKVLEKIGKSGEHETEIASILLDRGIDWNFPPAVLNEAKKVAQNAREEIKNYSPTDTQRKDFRNTTTFTIDPEDAKDFDDALSFKKLEGGLYEIGVHIADVSHYVSEGSSLDEEARDRSFSVYLVDRTIPMLPEDISNDIASLMPNQDRFTFSAVFQMDDKANVRSVWFGKTIIHSNKRFTYEEAQKVLDEKQGEFSNELETLHQISKRLKKKKEKKGAINFHQDEIKFKLDKNGKPVSLYKKEPLETHSLIEEFMLLANQHAAKIIETKNGHKQPFIYRVHDEPDPEKLAHLGIFLRASGYDFDTDGPVTSKDIQKILEKVSGSGIETIIEMSALRTMSKAAYSTKNIGHFGLAFSHYTHFTSPIRRYVDLIIHRLLWKFVNKEKVSKDAYTKYKKIAKEASEKELDAVDAERASIKYKKVEYMSEHIGEEFEARIVGIVGYGLFVEETETLTEGLVPVSSIGDDYYTYDEKNFQLKGEKSGRKFRLGDKVKVKVIETNIEEKTVTYELL